MTDSQNLLAEYIVCGSEPAFRELVSRYVDLVFSTALRLVNGDTQAAQDVTQSVFIDLAQKSKDLSKDVMLGGWLHRRTFNVATTIIRSERRRQSREREVTEMNALQDNAGMNFSQIAPILDEAIDDLAESDRTAILLRFFEQKEFRKIGETIRSSEDAARVRVNRALDKLQALLKRRGITSTAAAFSTVFTANAVQGAPASLTGSICTSALAVKGISVPTGITVAKTVTMTTLQKSLLVTALAVLGGAGIYQAHQVSQLRQQNQTLQQAQTPLADQIEQLQRKRDDLKNRVDALEAENSHLKSSQGAKELLKLRGEVGRLRQRTNELTEDLRVNRDLLAPADANSSTDQVSDQDRLTLQQKHADDAMTTLLNAFKKYAGNHGGQFPADFDQLALSGALATSNLAGNLTLHDFELGRDGDTDLHGKKYLLKLRVPIPRPSGGSIQIVGGIDDQGVSYTEATNITP